MKLFYRIVWVALALALTVGSLQALIHQHWAVPLVLQAETFEGQKVEPPALVVADDHAHGAPQAHAHDHHHEAPTTAAPWVPEDGLERSFWTWVANVLHVFALALFAQVALAAWTLRHGVAASWWSLGLGLAVTGWLSLHLWPALGLPAEIPGMDAARLGSRQGWWLLAAAGAGAACALLAFARGAWRWLAAVVALAVPFAVGAPHIVADPLAGFGPDAQRVLRALGEQFVVVTHLIAVSLWLMLGLAGSAAFVQWVRPLILHTDPAPVGAAAITATGA